MTIRATIDVDDIPISNLTAAREGLGDLLPAF